MKTTFRPTRQLPLQVFRFFVGLCFAASVGAEQLKEARVTEVFNDVKLLPSAAAPQPATVNADVRDNTAVRTGVDSRSELTFTDKTLARLGANTIFTFEQGTRSMELGGGAMLLRVPKGAGGAQIRTAAVTAAITGTTVMMEYHKGGLSKLVVLEGTAVMGLVGSKEKKEVKAGEMMAVESEATTLPEPVEVDLSRIMETSLLIVDFPPLESLLLIAREIEAQQANAETPPDGSLVLMGQSDLINTISTRTDAGSPAPTVTPTPSATPTPTVPPGPSKFGTPVVIVSSVPYVIGSGTTIQTDPTITTNGVMDFGKIYRGIGIDGPASVFFFGNTSAFDALIGFDAIVSDSGAVFKFQGLQLTGNPTVSTVGGELSLGLISVGSITSGGPGGVLTFAGLEGLLIATQNGSIILGPEISFAGLQEITFYARGIGSNLILGSAASTSHRIDLFAEGDIQVNGAQSTSLLRVHAGGNFLAGAGAISASSSIDLRAGNNVTFNLSQFAAGTNLGFTVTLDAGNLMNIDASGDQSVFTNASSILISGFTINLMGPPGTIISLNNATPITLTAGAGGIQASAVGFNGGNLSLISGGDIRILSATIPFVMGSRPVQGSIMAAGLFDASGDVTTSFLQAGTSVNVGGNLEFAFTLNAGATVTVGGELRGENVTAGGAITAGRVAVRTINAPGRILSVGAGGIIPFLFDPGGASLQHTFTIDRIVSLGGIDLSGNQFGGIGDIFSGGLLTITANTLAFAPAGGIAFANFNGADGIVTLTGEGGSGGTFIVNAAGDIVVGALITATTGVNAGIAFGGDGGTVQLHSSGGSVSVNSRIEVSSDEPGGQRVSASGGDIEITSDASDGVTISIGSSAQLLSLLNAGAIGPGGSIILRATGDTSAINIDNSGGGIRADRGLVDIRQLGNFGAINLTNANLRADVIKIGALGSDGTLTITGGTISADTILRLYAGGSNGSIIFAGNVTLSSQGLAAVIAAHMVTILNGVVVTISGPSAAFVFADVANYAAIFGGNGTTTGTFGGMGASTQPFGSAPPFDAISGLFTATYGGAASGNWSNPASWNPMIVPNNGNGGFTFNAVMGSGMLIQNIAPGVTIQRFFMDGGTLVLANPLTLNAGLQFTGSSAITGGILNIAGSSIHSSFMTVNNTTINNSGDYDLSLPSGNPFSGGGSVFNNSGTFRVTGGGVVDFTIALNNTGTLTVQNGTLRFTPGGTIGGALVAAGGAVLELAGNYTIANGTAFSGAGLFRFANGTTTTISGTVNNAGAILLNSTGSFTDLSLAGSVTLTGGGTLTLSNADRVRGSGILTNVNNTIQGETFNNGSLGLNEIGIINQAGGVIDANVSGLALVVDPNSADGLLNQGLMRASNGGILILDGNGGGAFTNTGTIAAITGGVLRFNGVVNSSGTVNVGNNTLTATGTYTQTGGSFLLAGGSAQSNNALNFQGGLLDGFGTINAAIMNNAMLRPALGAGGLAVTGNVSLLGSSQLIFQLGGLVQGTQYGFMNVNGVVTLGGQLVLSFVNGFQTTVTGANTFTLMSSSSAFIGAFTNIVSGSRLNTSDGFGSFLVTYSGSNLVLSNFISSSPLVTATYLGGTNVWSNAPSWSSNPLIPNNGNGGSNFNVIMGSGSLTQDIGGGVIIEQLQMNGGTLTLTNPLTVNVGLQFSGGSITNGVLNVAGTSTQSALMGATGLTLNNSGTYDLTLASGNLFSGAGGIFANSGTLTRSTGAGAVTFNNVVLNNTGTVSAAAGTLIISGGGTSSGLFSAASGAILQINGSYAFTNGASFSGPGVIRFNNNSSQSFAGTINNTAAIDMSAGGTPNTLTLLGNVSLTGNGSIALSGAARIRGSGVLTTANTIQGSSDVNGSLGFDEIGIFLQVGGLINANTSGEFLRVDPNLANGLVNQGTMQASNGGILLLIGDGGGVFNNTAGTISALNGSEVRLDNGVEIIGGTLATAGTGMIRILNGSATFAGAINLTGNLVIESGSVASLFLNGNVALSGGGIVNLVSAARIRGSGILTNANTIQGFSNVNGSIGFDEIGIVNQASGLIDANVNGQLLRVDPNVANGLVNQGLMRASNGGILLLEGAGGGAFTNTGTISAITGGILRFNGVVNSSGTVDVGNNTLTATGTYTQSGGSFLLAGGSVQSNNALNFQGGLLDGFGTINAAIMNNAMLRPALGTGGLAVTGNVSLLGSSQLIFNLGGLTQGTQYGFMNVNGVVTLGGQLVLSFVNGFQTTVTGANTFTLMSSSSAFIGAFTNIVSGSRLNTSDGFGSFLVTYSGNNLILSNFLTVPISAIWTGGSGNWSGGANWNINPNFPNNGQPSASSRYDVTLANGGTITLDLPITIENFTLSNGTVTGAQSLTINQLFTWNGGTLSGTGAINAGNGITLNSAGVILTLDGKILNNLVGSTANWIGDTSGQDRIALNNGAVFNNHGTFIAFGDMNIFTQSGGGVFNNFGTFTRAVNNGPVMIQSGVQFNNSGTVNVNTGALSLNGGDTGSTTGDFNVASGAILNFNGTFTFAATSDMAGAGVINFASGTQFLNGTYTLTDLNIGGGLVSNIALNVAAFNLGTSGAFASGQTLNASGLFTWGGSVSGAGVLNANGGITINGNLAGLIGKTVNNAVGQTATLVSGANLLFTNGAIFNNNGTFIAQNDGVGIADVGGGGTFNNIGTFTRAAGSILQVSTVFNNTGTVNLSSGTLIFQGGDSGNTTGDFTVGAGTQLQFLASDFTFAASSDFTGTGFVQFSGGTQTLNGTFNGPALIVQNGGPGSVNFNTAASTSTFNFVDGTVGGTGSITSSGLFTWSAGTLFGGVTVNANGGIFMNSGAVTLNASTLNNAVGQFASQFGGGQLGFSNGGIFNNNGTFLAQNDLGFLNAAAGGVFNNSGIFTRNSGAGTFTIGNGIVFNNTGTVNVQSGTLAFTGGYTQTAGTLDLGGGNVTSTSTLQIQGGLLSGFGSIAAAISNNAMLRPGLAAGGLAVTGNVSLLGSSQLIFQLGGLVQGTQYGFMNVNGVVTLGGQLVLSFVSGFQTTVTGANTFTLMSSSSAFVGAFTNIVSGSRLNTSDGFGSFLVTYSGNNLVLSNFLASGGVIPAIWTGGSGNWSGGANWNINPNFPNNGQPGAADLYNATLANGGMITLDIPITIQNFTLSNGTLTGANPLTVNQLFTWSGGTLTGGVTVNANGGTLLNSSPVSLDASTLNNSVAGQIFTVSGSGQIGFSNGAIINNVGTFLAQNDLSLADVGGGGTFNNIGTFTRNTGVGTFTIGSGVVFNNTGTVNVNSGALVFSGGDTGSTTGDFNVAASAALGFVSNFNFAASSDFSGAGIVFFNGGAQSLNGTFGIPNVTINGSTLTSNIPLNLTTFNLTSGTFSSAQSLTIGGLFTWNGGTVSGGGVVNANGGISFLNGGSLVGSTLNHAIGQTATLGGTANLVFGGGGIFNNNGTFLAQGTGGLLNGGGGTFNNTGTFTRNTSGSNFTVDNGVVFNNTGTVNVNSGSLVLNGGDSGNTTGDFDVSAGAILEFASNFNFAVSSAITGAGTVLFSNGTSNLNGSAYDVATFVTTLNGIVNITGTTSVMNLNVFGGILTGPGTLNVAGLLSWSDGAMDGSGITNANGGLLINTTGFGMPLLGQTLNNAAGQTATWIATPGSVGSIDMGFGAVFNNNGTFFAQTDHSITDFGGGGGTFNNNGTFTRNNNAGALTFDPNIAFNNSGTVNVETGTLIFNGGYTQTAGTLNLNGGNVSANSALNLQGGLLTGFGTLSAAISNNAMLRPGLAPGGLVVNGNVSLLGSSQLIFQLGGLVQGTQYGFMNVNGVVTLGGQLVLSFVNGFQTTVTGANTFTLMSSSSAFIGAFTNIVSGSRLNTSDGFGSFMVTYSGNNLILSNYLVIVTNAIWTGGSGNWSGGANWNINPNFPNNGQPGAADLYNVTLANGGTITLDIPITIQNFTLSNGTLTGTNNLTLNDLFTWSGGTISGSGVLNANGGMSLSGNGGLSLFGRALNNAAGQTATLSGTTTSLNLGNGALFNNNGTFLAQSNGGFGILAGTGNAFNNLGTFTRNTGTGTFTVGGSIAFNNTGVVNVQTGTLVFNGGDGGGTTGDFNIASGAMLRFDSSFDLGASADLAGAGTIEFRSGTINVGGTYNITGATAFTGATVNFNAPITSLGSGPLDLSNGTANFNSNAITVSALNLTGGTLGGTADVTSSGLLTWNLGTITGSGAINANGGISLSGNSGLSLFGRALNNAAGQTATLSGTTTSLNLGNGALFNNNGTFLAQSNAGGFGNLGGAGNSFNNAGTFTRNTGTGNFTVGGGVAFNNTGTVNLNSGTLILNGGDGGSTTGDFNISSGALLAFNSNFTFAASSDFSGAGNVLFQGGPITFNGTFNGLSISVSGGTVNFNAPVNPTLFTLQGGTVGGTGNITSSLLFTWSAGTLTGSGVFTAGDILLNDMFNNAVILDGKTLNNPILKTATMNGIGGLNFANGAIFNNNGLFRAQNNAGFSDGGGGGTFNNTQTFTRNTGTGNFTVGPGVAFNNSAVVNAQTGTLILSGGGSASGSFNISTGATLRFVNNYTFTGTSNLSGAGNLNLQIATFNLVGGFNVTGTSTFLGSTVNFNSPVTGIGALVNTVSNIFFNSNDVTFSSLTMTGGTLGGTIANFASTGLISWSSGTINGAGAINANGGILWNTAQVFLDQRVLNNGFGQTATMSNTAEIIFTNGATINNHGTFLVQTTGTTDAFSHFGGGGFFNNFGTFTRNTGTTDFLVAFGIAFNNSGTVNVDSGMLTFQGNYTQTAGTTQLGGGTIASFNPLQINGGLLTGFGAINGAINNNAMLRPGLAPGGLIVTGNVGFLAASNLVFQLGGLTQGTQYGFLNVNGVATLNGQLVLSFVNGFQTTVSPGDTFTLMSSSSLFVGAFANIVSGNRLLTSDGLGSFTVLYAGNQLVLSGFMASVPIASNWIGAAGNWSNGVLWSTTPNFPNNGLPGPTDVYNVTLNNGGTITLNLPITIQNFTLSNGVLTGANSLRTNQLFTWNGGTLAGGITLNANGGIILNGGAMQLNGGTLNNAAGQTALAQASSLIFSNLGVFNNNGIFQAPAGLTWISGGGGGGSFNNAGTFTGNTGLSTFTFGSGVVFNNSGTVTVNSGGLAFDGGYTQSAGTLDLAGGNVSSAGTLQIQGGSLTGFGTINAALSNNAMLRPGLAPGGLMVNGNVSLLGSSQLTFNLGGLTQGSQYGFLNVTGTVTLGGNLVVSFVNGFVAAGVDNFTVLSSTAPLTGIFANVASGARLSLTGAPGSFLVTYSGNTIVFSDYNPSLLLPPFTPPSGVPGGTAGAGNGGSGALSGTGAIASRRLMQAEGELPAAPRRGMPATVNRTLAQNRAETAHLVGARRQAASHTAAAGAISLQNSTQLLDLLDAAEPAVAGGRVTVRATRNRGNGSNGANRAVAMSETSASRRGGNARTSDDVSQRVVEAANVRTGIARSPGTGRADN